MKLLGRIIRFTVAPMLLLGLCLGPVADSSAKVRFLAGTTAQTVVNVLEPWTQSSACSCCVCWETALSTVYAWWDDRGFAGSGPWTKLLPGGGGFDENAFRTTSQKIYEIADIDCGEGGFSGFWFIANKAATVGRSYTNGLNYDFEHDFDDFVWFGQDIADEIDADKPVYYAFSGPFKDIPDAVHATVAVGYNDSNEIVYIYNNWDPWTDSRGLGDDTDSRTLNIMPGGCDCTVGSCCAGCGFKPQGTVCDPTPNPEWGCPWGTGCGSDVGWRTYQRVCTGESSTCLSSSYGPWSAWSVASACNDNQRCVQGQQTCVSYGTCSPAQDTCLEGEHRCATRNAYQVCAPETVGGALIWGVPVDCEQGLVCSDGLCVPPCVNTCSEGERRCSGKTDVETCLLDDDGCFAFGAPKNCASGEVCSGGECVAACVDECEQDERQCVGSTAYALCRVGDTDDCLHFGEAQSCPEGWTCSAGSCVVPDAVDEEVSAQTDANQETLVMPDSGTTLPDEPMSDNVTSDGQDNTPVPLAQLRSSGGGCSGSRGAGEGWTALLLLGIVLISFRYACGGPTFRPGVCRSSRGRSRGGLLPRMASRQPLPW